ncbi:MAG TPA: IS1182 family transposase [Herpetosiphonaceae bacterium]|nr:IS1182 family transposase [Herpetosiphonaceae bacterium]
MSLQAPLAGDYPIPDDTYRVAHAAFPKGNLYLQLRDHFGMLYQDHQFAHLFAHVGRPALAPARLALVTVFQFIEGVSDRQAADNVRDRISWKYALGLPLDDPGFDFSVLSEFRTRLLHDDAEVLLFDTVLDLVRAAGLLKARGKQRTDSTHVLAAIRELHRLENVGETLRHALDGLAVEAPRWLRTHADPAWVERYAARIEQYRLPKTDVARQALALTIGQDGYRLLEQLYAPGAPAELRALPAVETLRQVWVQQYYRSTIPPTPALRWRGRDEQPPSARLISSPYDAEARYKTKRDTSWLGYKVHLTETCDDETPNLITHVATTPATTDDSLLTGSIHADLAAKDLLPAEHYVDMGYTSAAVLVESEHAHGVTVVGPVQGAPQWQAQTPEGLTAAQFAIDWEAEQVVCPAGHTSRTWLPYTDRQGQAGIVVQFARATCLACPLRERCTRATATGRQLCLRPQAQHTALQLARTWQETEEFKAAYARRAGVEGTFTQANRRCDLRQARYVGLRKVHVQHLLTAIAINLVRVVAWLAEVPRATTRRSPFAALMAQGC